MQNASDARRDREFQPWFPTGLEHTDVRGLKNSDNHCQHLYRCHRLQIAQVLLTS